MHGAASLIHLDGVLLVVAAWLLVGMAGVLALRRFKLVSRVLFPLGGLLGLLLFALALSAVFDTPEVAVLPIGLPTLPIHLRLDSLSAFFLMVIGCTAAGVSAFAAGYFRRGEGTPPGLLCLEAGRERAEREVGRVLHRTIAVGRLGERQQRAFGLHGRRVDQTEHADQNPLPVVVASEAQDGVADRLLRLGSAGRRQGSCEHLKLRVG